MSEPTEGDDQVSRSVSTGGVAARWGGTRWLVSNGLILAGLGWMLVDHVLTWTRPLEWGGPNIGGGFLLLIADVLVVTGLVVLLTGGTALGRHLRSCLQAPQQALPLAVNVLLVVSLGTLHVIRPASAQPSGIDGQVGITVNPAGSPVLLLEVCRGSVTAVHAYGPNRHGRPNPVLAQLHAQRPITTSVAVDLEHPDSSWRGSPLAPGTPTGTLLLVFADGPSSELHEVDVRLAELDSLTPATVQYSTYSSSADDLVSRRTPRAGFHHLACTTLIPAR